MNLSRLLWAGLGLVSLALGYVGIFVPGLPTTVFVLIAVVAFARSSPRLDRWLRSLPVFSKAVAQADRYREHGTISRRVKLVAQGFAWGSVLLVLVSTGLGWPLFFVTLAALACSLFMHRTKTAPVDKA